MLVNILPVYSYSLAYICLSFALDPLHDTNTINSNTIL